MYDPNDYEENAACGDQVDDQFADPTERIEIHGNEAYQTTATADPTQQNATYSGQVEDQFDCEENAAYSGQVDYQFDCKEYGGRVDNQDHIVPDYQ